MTRKGISPEKERLIYQLGKDGLSPARIVKVTGIADMTVRKYLAKQKIDTRSKVTPGDRKINCPKCNSLKTTLAGHSPNGSQLVKCTDCGKRSTLDGVMAKKRELRSSQPAVKKDVKPMSERKTKVMREPKHTTPVEPCRHCGSLRTRKDGKTMHGKQNWFCNDCGRKTQSNSLPPLEVKVAFNEPDKAKRVLCPYCRNTIVSKLALDQQHKCKYCFGHFIPVEVEKIEQEKRQCSKLLNSDKPRKSAERTATPTRKVASSNISIYRFSQPSYDPQLRQL